MSASNFDPKVIQSLPAAILESLPAEAAPEGTQPDFTHPPSRVAAIVGVGIAFLVLAVVCFSIRIYTKLAIAKRWRWDDLTCSLGFMCSIVYFVVVVLGSIKGATGKHQWDLHLDKLLNKSSLNQDYITTIMVTPALGLIKFSLFIQYYLLFKPLRWVRVSVWIGGTISAIFYIAITITAFVMNSPWGGESLLEDVLSWHYLKFAQFSIPTGVIGIVVDWYLFILPLPAVLNLKMSIARRFGILIIFMTGGLAAIASIVSLYYRIQLQESPNDLTWRVGYVLLWAQIEMFAGVAASSMPTVSQFFKHQDLNWGSSLKSTLINSLSSSMRQRLFEYKISMASWRGSGAHTSEEQRQEKRTGVAWLRTPSNEHYSGEEVQNGAHTVT